MKNFKLINKILERFKIKIESLNIKIEKLIPLSQITDEDVIAYYKYSNKNTDIRNCKVLIEHYKISIIQLIDIHYLGYQYLQQKGYDIPKIDIKMDGTII